MKEKRILEITPTGDIRKGFTLRGQGFILPVTYRLEDGTSVESSITATRKKDVLPRLERERVNAANGSMTATFSQSGEFFGTTTRMVMCGSGLIPMPALS